MAYDMITEASGIETRENGRDIFTRWAGPSLVGAGILFNFVLCFVASRGVPVNLPIVAGAELAIIASVLALIWRDAVHSLTVPIAILVPYLIILGLVGGLPDPKIGPELAMISGFFLLGRRASTPVQGDWLIWTVAWIVFGLGLFEYFAQDTFESWFNVFNYYVGKGALSLSQANDTGTTLAENGIRPEGEGRQLLPGLLGLHRVGSLFLEPVSAGNFATICTAWVLARRDVGLRGLALVGLGLAIAVLADARFGIFSSLAVAAFLITPFWRSRLIVASLPIVMVCVLCAYGAIGHTQVDNSFAGRIYGSGSLLDKWTLGEWLGLGRADHLSMDSGYSYLFGDLGLIACLILWVAVVLRRESTEVSTRFFAAITIYGSLSLCISGSFLSIKTAALMWFLYGALQNPAHLPCHRFREVPHGP